MEKDESYWKKKLTPEQYSVLRARDTEAPFSGVLLYNKGKGVYKCGACASPIFKSDSKFDSKTGWPSFDCAIPGSVTIEKDCSYGMERTEVKCAKCGSHLGHVFDDGPTATGKRYCMNSCALGFWEKKEGIGKKGKK